MLDRLIILCTFGHTHTLNISVHIHTAPVTSHLDPGRKQSHALILGDPFCESNFPNNYITEVETTGLSNCNVLISINFLLHLSSCQVVVYQMLDAVAFVHITSTKQIL